MRSRSAKVLANRRRSSNNERTLRKIARVRLVDSPRGNTNVRMADISVVAINAVPRTGTIPPTGALMGSTGWRQQSGSEQGLGQVAPLPLRHRSDVGCQDLDA